MDYTAEKFSQHLNTKFTVKVESVEPLELELVGVEVRKTEPNEQQGMERFSTFFHGPPSFFLPQQTYELIHPVAGEMQIFLVPIARDQNGTTYEAVFNRFVDD
jgi:hypothetical protein